MEKLNKLSLPAVILIASIILGSLYYASQVNKQRSIERQQQIKIEQEKQEQLDIERQQERTIQSQQTLLDICLDEVDEKYTVIFQELIRACNTSSDAYNCGISVDEKINKEIKEAKDGCFKKYPQN